MRGSVIRLRSPQAEFPLRRAAGLPTRPKFISRSTLAGLIAVLCFSLISYGFLAGTERWVGEQPDGSYIIPTGQALTPAGTHIEVNDRPLGMALSPDGALLVVVTGSNFQARRIHVLDVAAEQVRQTINIGNSFVGVAFSPDGQTLYVGGGADHDVKVYQREASGTFTADGVIPIAGAAPSGLSLSPDGATLYVALNLGHAVGIVDTATRQVTEVRAGSYPYTTLTTPDGAKVYVSNWGGRWPELGDVTDGVNPVVVDPETGIANTGTVSVLDAKSQIVMADIEVGLHPSGMALSPDGNRLYVANANSDTISVIDTASDTVVGTLDVRLYADAPLGSAPNALAVSADGATLYVANAANNAVAVVCLDSPRWNPDGIPMESGQVGTGRGSLGVEPGRSAISNLRSEISNRRPRMGLRDLKSEISNLKSEISSGGPASGAGGLVRGFIPTGWFPTAVTPSADGQKLIVASGYGFGSVAPVPPGQGRSYRDRRGVISILDLPDAEQLAEYTRQVLRNNRAPGSQRTAAIFGGSGLYRRLPRGNAQEPARMPALQLDRRLSGGNAQRAGKDAGATFNAGGTGARDVRFQISNLKSGIPNLRSEISNRRPRMGLRDLKPRQPIPMNLGEGSPIRYIFYVVKENRTYDQVFGDIPEGNGDPRLVQFGEEVTPNHHALARRYVLFDNFYVAGDQSALGHQWCQEGYANDYMHKYGNARSGSHPMSFAPTGFLWTNARRHGKTVRVYGEFGTTAISPAGSTWTDIYRDWLEGTNRIRITSRTRVRGLADIYSPDYPSFQMRIVEQRRLDVFLREFREFERNGNLPELIIMVLPINHTNGTSPGYPTPRAMVADNDLALGRLVEAITHSRYWPESAIFVVEDDAQNGLDHIDGHRTVGLVISPYAQRGTVDSTLYTQINMFRTMEQILGLPPLNQFDLAAEPMFTAFTDVPDFTPYEALPNKIPLDEMNPGMAGLRGLQKQLAEASLQMDFSDPDVAPEDLLNRAIWHSVKGFHTPYPDLKRAVRVPDRFAGRSRRAPPSPFAPPQARLN